MRPIVAVALLLLAPPPAGAAPRRSAAAAAPLPAAAWRAGYEQNQESVAAMCLRTGKWDEAIVVLDAQLAQAPQRSDVLARLTSACLHSSGCAPRRAQLVRESLEQLRTSPEWVDDLSAELVGTGAGELAVAELGRLLQRHPEDDRVRAILIDTALELGKRARALAELPGWLLRHPADLARRTAYVELLRDAGAGERFRGELDALLRDQPDHLPALLLRAEHAVDRLDLAAAGRDLERMRALAPRWRELAQLETRMRRLRAQQRQGPYDDFRRDVVFSDFAHALETEDDREP